MTTVTLRILRILPSIDPRGGGPMEAARRIDAELQRLGHSIEVVTLDAPDAAFLRDYPAPVHALGPARWGYQYARGLVPWLQSNRARFDAVVVDGLWQYHAFAAWRALAGTATPYFVFPHGMLDPWFKRAYPLKHLKKWLYWPWADYRVLRDARAALFTCEEERRVARESFWLYSCNEVIVSFGTQAPPTDDSGELAQRFVGKWPALVGKRVLLFLSRIHEKKGCDLLIHAFANVAASDPGLHLVMAGPDQTGWASALKRQATDLGISERITWTGMLQGDDKWGAFYASDAFCLPSHQENFGIVVAEALGCGLPVLVSDKVNIWREIDADGVGIVRPDTPTGTVNALQTWLRLPPADRHKMRLAARESFQSRYRIEQVAQGLAQQLTAQIGSPSSAQSAVVA